MINRRLINAFRAALNLMEVSELRLHGRRFIWTGTCQQQPETKIDHVFHTAEWGLLFPQCLLQAVTSSVSDHCAMILTGQLSCATFKGFRFE